MNNPKFGLTFIFHVVIALVVYVKRRDILNFLKTSTLVGVVFLSGFVTINYDVGENTGRVLLGSTSNLFNCQENKPIGRKNKVIIRLDDVTSNFYTDSTKQIISDVMDYNGKVTLGVIPQNISNDLGLYFYIKTHLCNLEIAHHGWEHSSSPAEFELLDEKEAYEKLTLGLIELNKHFTKDVNVFIPPENLYSLGTHNAAMALNFKYISSEGDKLYDFSTSTYDFVNKRHPYASEMLEDCIKEFDQNRPCIIMVHPQDFVTDGELDPYRYQQFKDLLLLLNYYDSEFVNFKDL